jgi:hypothetical protein
MICLKQESLTDTNKVPTETSTARSIRTLKNN